MSEPRPTSPRGLGYLPGVDGLRAFSVIAVLLYHADQTWIPGGFLGVEVFFVISGYLITLLLLNEHERTGTISLGSFWIRRARRLLPALFTLLLVTMVGVALFWREELAELRGQVVAAFTYSTNWYDIVEGRSYFAAAGRPPVLRHLWSLAVEEQFYLLWPLILFGLVWLLRSRRGALATVIGLGAAGSALLMATLYEPAADPSRIYYGTDTRASGLLLGAVLAVVWRPHELRGRAPVVVDTATIGSVVGLAWCFLTIHEWDRFLYQGGFVVVGLLTVVAIAGVAHPASTVGRVLLGNPVMTWIGVRSYGLYLWHWPIYVFTRPEVDVPWGETPTLVLRLALTAVVAELSYRYIEAPIRAGALGRGVARLRAVEAPRRLVRRQLLMVTAFVVLAPATVSLVNAQEPPEPSGLGLALDDENAGPAEAADGGDTDAAAIVPAGAAVASLGAPGTAAADGAAEDPTITAGEPDGSDGSTSAATSAPGSTSTSASASASASAPTPASGGSTSEVATTAATPRYQPGRVTIVADSVLWRVQDEMTAVLEGRGWSVDYRGKAALMLDKAEKMFRESGTPVGEVVVIALGYNSLWERDRAHYDRWARNFDEEADALIATLTELGAKRFVWVTLREPDRDVIPKGSAAEYKQYAWFFPYANERIRLLPDRHDNLVLADWTAISNVPGITGDLIHLNTKGFRLMSDLIVNAGGF